VTWRLDQCGDKPLHDDPGQLWVHLEHISSMATVSGNPSCIGRLVPEPRRILGGRVVHQFLAGAGCCDIKQFHRVLRRRIFVFVGKHEQLGQLRCLMQKLKTITKSLTRHQDQRLYLRMPARRFHRPNNAEPARSTRANGIAVHPGLRNQIVECCVDVLRRLFVVVFAAAFAMPAAVDGENVHASRCQLLGNAVPGSARAIALMKQQRTGS